MVQPSSGAESKQRRVFRSSGGVFAAVFGMHVLIALAVGVQAWDDGFITLAFSRTFAETGHIALTPVSEQVEGATSPLWFLMMAGLYATGAFSDFFWFHFASQLVAAICSATTAVLFFRLIRPAAPAAAWWITLVVFLLGPIRAETSNGMEMSLLCLVVVAILALLQDGSEKHWKALSVLTALVPWIRLEAIGYLFVAVLAVWLLSRAGNRRSYVAMFIAGAVSLAVLTGVRYLVFGTVVLTNTMLAKRMPPYSPPYPSPAWWEQQIHGLLFEPAVTALPAVVIFFILLRISGKTIAEKISKFKCLARTRDLPLVVSFGLAYTAAFFAFTVVFGANTFSLPGRMGMSATIVLVVAAVHAAPIPEASYRAMGKRSRGVIVGMFLVPCVGLFAYDSVGMTMRVAQVVSDDQRVKVHSFSAFHANGLAIDHVRSLLGLPEISVLLTDVGQPGLCCEKIKILDFGLLANSELTRTGWAGFPEYLRKKNPDLIQLHSSFTQESGITKDEYFVVNYVPVFVDMSLFYLRKDHYEAVKNKCDFVAAPEFYFFSGGEPLTSQKGAPIDSALHIDKDYLSSLKLDAYCRLR